MEVKESFLRGWPVLKAHLGICLGASHLFPALMPQTRKTTYFIWVWHCTEARASLNQIPLNRKIYPWLGRQSRDSLGINADAIMDIVPPCNGRRSVTFFKNCVSVPPSRIAKMALKKFTLPYCWATSPSSHLMINLHGGFLLWFLWTWIFQFRGSKELRTWALRVDIWIQFLVLPLTGHVA